MASLDKQLSIIVWSSPDFDSISLSLVLLTKVKKVQHKRMVIKNSFVTKDQNMKQKSKRIQETKWFGKDVWPVGRYTFLHSGRPLPGDQERASRNEGVGITLDEKATVAWKNAGEVWEVVSSRINIS